MKELNDEIKLTLNLMQTDIDDGAHDELQSHLYSLLEIKRNELQKRLVGCKIEYVENDQIPYKIANEDKPLTPEELKAGWWWCEDVSEECRLVFADAGFNSWADSWDDNADVRYAYNRGSNSSVTRAHEPIDLTDLKQIHRIGNDFYWSEV